MAIATLLCGVLILGANTVDLRQMGHLSHKGRVQDREYNPDLPLVAQLIALGPDAIPVLVSQLDNESKMIGEAGRCVMDDPRVGDVALLILCDFFLRPDWRTSTVPEIEWQQLHSYGAKHGRHQLRRRVERLFAKYTTGFLWKRDERCFAPARAAKEIRRRVVGHGSPSL